MDSVYKKEVLDHVRNPRKKGALDEMTFVERGKHPRCGDEVEVGVNIDEQGDIDLRFNGRGCAICMASASLMCECISGLSTTDASNMTNAVIENQFNDLTENQFATATKQDNLQTLQNLRQLPAREKCTLIAWQALHSILEKNRLLT